MNVHKYSYTTTKITEENKIRENDTRPCLGTPDYMKTSHPMIVDRFAKYLTAVEYPKEKTSWNIEVILKDKNAFYRFDVRDMKRESANHLFQTGRTDTKADKMVFELKSKWIIIDIEELHKYIKEQKEKQVNLDDLLEKLEWNIIVEKS